MRVDKVEPVVLQGVVRLGRHVQVAVSLLVAHVHLDPWVAKQPKNIKENSASLFYEAEAEAAATHLRPGRRRRRR